MTMPNIPNMCDMCISTWFNNITTIIQFYEFKINLPCSYLLFFITIDIGTLKKKRA